MRKMSNENRHQGRMTVLSGPCDEDFKAATVRASTRDHRYAQMCWRRGKTQSTSGESTRRRAMGFRARQRSSVLGEQQSKESIPRGWKDHHPPRETDRRGAESRRTSSQRRMGLWIRLNIHVAQAPEENRCWGNSRRMADSSSNLAKDVNLLIQDHA